MTWYNDQKDEVYYNKQVFENYSQGLEKILPYF